MGYNGAIPSDQASYILFPWVSVLNGPMVSLQTFCQNQALTFQQDLPIFCDKCEFNHWNNRADARRDNLKKSPHSNKNL
jgi:hypothetical protein